MSAQHLLQAVAAGWRRWRTVARRRAEQRSLQGLSDATLRDIGMAERVWREPTSSYTNDDRMRW